MTEDIDPFDEAASTPQGSSGTLIEKHESYRDKLQPLKGSSGTEDIGMSHTWVVELQPLKGSFGTRAGDLAVRERRRFNPSRVRLELGRRGRPCSYELLQPLKGSFGTCGHPISRSMV